MAQLMQEFTLAVVVRTLRITDRRFATFLEGAKWESQDW